MQPQSMTGYGRGTSGDFKVEVRSSNHKNIDVHINLPHYLFSYDHEIRKIVRRKFNRGRIDIYIPKHEVANVKLKVNKALAKEYYNALYTLKNELSIDEEIGIDILASQRDIFVLDEPEIDEGELYGAVEMALDELTKTREEEGRNLIDDILSRLKLIDESLRLIENGREEYISGAQERLHERLKELLGTVLIEESRLIQETAIIIEKSDITEEIVRLKSHMKQYGEVLRSGDTIGKKLDFIVQEMRREVNTISAKTHDIVITATIVEMRHEIEKIKEQIQNLQ